MLLETWSDRLGYGRVRPPRPDITKTGWILVLPNHAARIYMTFFLVLADQGFPLPGDLDDPDANEWVRLLAPGGLDQPYDPSADPYPEDGASNLDEPARWEEWQSYAKARGLPMATYRHIFEFMLELGLIERREDADGVFWLNGSSLPQVDEVLQLPPDRQARLAERRWRERFYEQKHQITDWMRGLRTPDAERLEFQISIQALAERVGLDPEDARHALALLVDEDIECDVDPETTAMDAPLRITIDWQLFEELRTLYTAVIPGEEAND